MPLQSNEPKGRFWERTSLPTIDTLTPGSYMNPQITVDQFGRITTVSSGATAAVSGVIGAQISGTAVPNGPFNTINFIGSNISVVGTDSSVLNVTFSNTSSILALDENIVVQNGPFSTLNFTGGGVSVSNGGNGRLDIAITEPGTVTNNVGYLKTNGNTTSSQNLGSIPTTAILHMISITIGTEYDTGTTLEIIDGSNNSILVPGMINPQLSGTYRLEFPDRTTAIQNPNIILSVNGSPISGSCVVEIIYQTP